MIDIHHWQDLDKFSFMHDLQHRVILDAKDDLYVAGTPVASCHHCLKRKAAKNG